ncbi:MAG TPA: hypothetical protein VIY49_25535 [Bryobacteraceae bacterium]
MLNADEQMAWRRAHIPHRVRAAVANLDMKSSILQVHALISAHDRDDPFSWRCAGDSMWEGRQAATRWLIELIGVKMNKDGKLGRPTRKPPWPDVGLEHFDGGSANLFDLSNADAGSLAKIWKGCTQASSHPTHNSNHPPVDEQPLSRSLAVVVQHLQDTIYQRAGESLRDYVLTGP